MGVALRGELQLLVDSDVVGATCLMLHGVNVGDDAVVESFVVWNQSVVVTIRVCGRTAQHGAGGDHQGGQSQRLIRHIVSSLATAARRWPVVDCGSPFDLLLPWLQLCFRAIRIRQIYYAFPFRPGRRFAQAATALLGRLPRTPIGPASPRQAASRRPRSRRCWWSSRWGSQCRIRRRFHGRCTSDPSYSRRLFPQARSCISR